MNVLELPRFVQVLLFVVLAAPLLLPFGSAAAPATKEFRKEIAVKPGVIVVLENLAGKVTIEGKRDGPVEIMATVHAEGADLLAELPIDVAESGGRIEVTAKYPVDKHDVFRYEGEEGGFKGWSSTTTTYLGRKVKIVSGRFDRGVELWADFHLRLPVGTGASVRNEVGRISASNVAGPLTARTGSGDVALLNVTGDASVDTGSGGADIEGVTGSVRAHTGSGSITLKRVDGEHVKARTGSGEITLRGVKAALDLGTGSGDIRGDELTVAGALDLDTGSGDVRLAGDFGSLKEARVGTASGDVVLRMAKAPGMSLSCRTSSGDIDVDVPGTKLRTEKKLEIAVGGGGAPVRVRTSSGSIRIEGK